MDIHLALAGIGTFYTFVAMLFTILKFREARKRETEDTKKDTEEGKRRRRTLLIMAGAFVGIPVIVVVLLWHFLPTVPGAGIAYISEYPEPITIGQYYTLGGSVKSERIPQGWELWAIKKGLNEYWPASLEQNRDDVHGTWSIEFNDGDGSYMKDDVEFRIVIGLTHPDISDEWTQWNKNAGMTGNWTGILYSEIPLTDSLWSPQDSVNLLRPYRCVEVKHEYECIKYSGE